jgi:MFS family permease
VGLGAVLIAVSKTPSWGWLSAETVVVMVFGLLVLAAWVYSETHSAEPLVDMKMMRIRGVWTTNTVALLLGFGMYSSFILLPQYVETPEKAGYGFGASVTGAGLFLLPSTAGMLLASPLAGRLSSTVGSRVPLLLGTAITTAAFLLLAVAHTHPGEIYLAAALMGVGIGFAFSALANLIVEAVEPHETGVATGMNTVMRSIGGAVGGQIGASVLAANVAADGLATEHGFTIAFALAAGALLVSTLTALAVPRPQRRAAQAVPQAATA